MVATSVAFAVRHPTLSRYAAAAVVYGVAIVACFHAVALHPGSRLYGFNDGTAAIRSYWAASVEHRDPFTFSHDAFNGAPQGVVVTPATTLALSGLQAGFVWGLRSVLGLVGGMNAYMLIGMFATAIAMFWFLTRLGCTLAASLLGGYVFAFSPYALERVYAGHLGLLQNWIFALLAVVLLSLHERRSSLLAATAGGTIALAFYLSAYQGLFASFMVFVFFVIELAGRREVSGRPAPCSSARSPP